MTTQNSNDLPPELTPTSGSYHADDVTLLLDIVSKDSISNVPVTEKEALIQTGAQHYSDMLTLEQKPSSTHERIYQQALQQGQMRMAKDIAKISTTLHAVFNDIVSQEAPLILVSLVRAGLPVGVLLQRALRDSNSAYGLPSCHYGMSIIRDRGLDVVAMQHILNAHPNSPIVFVDGWTGKGAIYGELVRSLRLYNDSHGKSDSPSDTLSAKYFMNVFHQGAGTIPLVTLADPAAVSWLSASTEDWLIPSGLLGSTISGLISRTLFSTASEDLRQGLHRSVIYDDLIDYDHSLAFVQTVDSIRQRLFNNNSVAKEKLTPLPTHDRPRYTTQPIIDRLAKRYNVANPNRIKPTIAEATRAIMRRDPERVLLATANHPDTALLRYLCDDKGVDVEVVGTEILPYQAVTIIKKRS